MKPCPACRAQLADTATSCKHCGHGGAVVPTSAATKACPFCAEPILRTAIKCKHCGSMLDGSSQKVTVAGADPFAEYHTDIKGKKAGKVTVVGYLGIGVGVLAIAVSGLAIARGGPNDGPGILVMFLFGMAFILASYFWARR